MRWLAYTGWAAAIGLALLVAYAADVETWRLTQDPAQVARVPGWTGALSTIGVMGWAFASGSCLTAALVVGSVEGRSERVLFLLATGLVLAYLAIDDGLLLHDDTFPYRLNIPQPVVLAVMGVALLGYAVRFRHELLQGDNVTLALAVTALGVAGIADPIEVLSYTLEDSIKLFGIGLLAYWCLDRSRLALTDALRVRSKAAR